MEWVKVSDRLPEVSGTYIATLVDDENKFIYTADLYYESDEKKFVNTDYDLYEEWHMTEDLFPSQDHIIAWMPYPEPADFELH